MSETVQPAGAIDQRAQDGFENEVATLTGAPAQKEGRAKKKDAQFGSELSRNFNSIFGHGVGKIALFAGGAFIVVACAFAVRGFAHKGVQTPSDTVQVDIPRPPSPRVSLDPIDPREAQRRAQQAAREADVAERKGQSYQADFTPAVARTRSAADSTFGSQPQISGLDKPTTSQPPDAPAKPSPVPVSVTLPTGSAAAQANARLLAQEEQHRQAALDRERAAREKYVDELRNGVKAQIEELIGERDGLRSAGGYSIVRYMPVEKAAVSQGIADGHEGAVGSPVTPQTGAPPKRILFKAGKTLFATLDSEVNTDDGGDVFATVRGGTYDGSKLIGKIEQAPRNIRLHFSVLAPQDDRPTLSVDAIAIREQDAKEGVAESIDHHTIERYSALFAGSVLQGLGQAAAQPQGTAVLQNGQAVVEQQELTNKRIAMFALGGVGTNAGAQVRQTFGEPPTYKTPANKGIGVVFLTDVAEK